MENIYFFDCNCSFGKLKNGSGLMPKDKDTIIEIMKKVNIKKAIPTHTSQKFLGAKAGNEILVSEIENDDMFIPLVTVLPNSSGEFINLEKLDEFVVKNSIKFANMFPKTHGFSPAEWQMGDTYSYLEKKGIPLLISISEVTADEMYGILSNHKSLKVICKDTSYTNDMRIMRLMELFENFYLETGTYHTCDGISYITEKFGAQRLIFGSNLPSSDPGAAIAKVACADISLEDKIKIAHKNLEKLIEGVK